MGAIADLTTPPREYSNGNDSVVIRRYEGGITGGRTLDMTGYAGDYVRAGHIVIFDPSEETYKPMPVENGAYTTLPSGYQYAGVVVASKLKSEPFVAIMYAGEVNDIAMPYPLTEAMRTALKTAFPCLMFTHD